MFALWLVVCMAQHCNLLPITATYSITGQRTAITADTCSVQKTALVKQWQQSHPNWTVKSSTCGLPP